MHGNSSAPSGLVPSAIDLAGQLGQLTLFCVASVPFGIATALRKEPLRSRTTQADETFWIVPEISFGPMEFTPAT